MQIFDEKFSNCLRFSIKLKNKFVSLLHENAAMHLHPYIKKPRLFAEAILYTPYNLTIRSNIFCHLYPFDNNFSLLIFFTLSPIHLGFFSVEQKAIFYSFGLVMDYEIQIHVLHNIFLS